MYYLKVIDLFGRLIGGGNWNNSGYAGPSSRNGNNSALNTNTNVSARGWIRNAANSCGRLGLYPFLVRQEKHTTKKPFVSRVTESKGLLP